MLITEKKYGTLKIVNIFFMEEPVTANIPDCDVIIYHTYKNWGNIEGFDRISYLTTTIDLRQNIDNIWCKIHRQHKRHIRRAKNEGTRVFVSDNYEEFHRIYTRFMKQKNYADRFGFNIPSSKFMRKYGLLFIAENKGEILGGNIYFNNNGNVLLAHSAYQKSGNSIENTKQSVDANCYLQWEAIQYFKNLDGISYDLGGLDSDEINIHHQMPGLNYFKLSFGGDIISHYEYRRFDSRFNKLLFSSWNFLQKSK